MLSRLRLRRLAVRLPLSNPIPVPTEKAPRNGCLFLLRQELQSPEKDGYNARTSMDHLAKLFGSAARLKLLRLFIFNDDVTLLASDAAFRARLTKDATRKELTQLVAAGIVRKKTGKSPLGYTADKRFPHYDALKVFLRTTSDISDDGIVTSLKKAGTVRLVVLSGLFTGAIESKVDVLIVGDRMEERPLASAIHVLEAELGRELRYACFSTEQFKYRLGVYDRLLRDVFDYPNRVIIDKIGLVSR